MVNIKASKQISELKKGDKIKVDGHEYLIDAHYLFIDHKTTKEMVLEIYDPKLDKDFQLRYFDDQVATSLEFYELKNEFMYVKKEIEKAEW